MKVSKRFKEFLLDTIIVGGLVSVVAYTVLDFKNEQLKQQLRTPYTAEQKVEFNLPCATGVGWTDPQNQRIYLKVDIDSDGLLDTYYIENPFLRDKFILRLDAHGRAHLSEDY